MAFAAPLLMLGGSVVSAYGQLKQGAYANAEAQYSAREMEVQSQQAHNNARRVLDEGEARVRDLKSDRDRNLAAQQAAAGASGIQLTGSAVHVLRDSAIEAEEEIAQARYQSRVEAYNYGTQGNTLLAQAALTRASGRHKKRSAALGAVGTGLAGAGSAWGTYKTMPKS